MSTKYKLAIVLIIAIAVFFRFWHFDSIPSGLYQDEAMNGADALASLSSGDYKVFYQNNNGREGLIIWLDALAIKAFGAEPWVLRLFPAIAGVLAVLGLFFLAKKLFDEKTALVSSFLMAVSFWAVNFSRIGFRAGLMLPFLLWSFYFLLRGFSRPKSKIDFILAGVLFGLGFYTYISFRVAPALALIGLVPLLIRSRDKNLWMGVLVFIVSVFIVALPLGLYFVQHPSDFFARSAGVSIFTENNLAKALLVNIVTTVGMFNVAGDFNWRHNYAGAPELFFPVGLMFLLGVVVGVKRRAFGDKLILTWFLVFLTPNLLASEGNPHALRALGALPAAMIFSGIGIIWGYRKITRYFDDVADNQKFAPYRRQLLRLKKEFFLLLIAFLVFIGGYGFYSYFIRWAPSQAVASAFSREQVKLARYLNGLPGKTKKYVLWHPEDRATDNGLPVAAQTVFFLTAGKTEINFLQSDKLEKIVLGQQDTVIAPIYFDRDLLRTIKNRFTGSAIEFIDLNAAAIIIP